MQFRKDERYSGDVLIGGKKGTTPIIEISTSDVTFYDVHVSWNHSRASGNWNWIVLSGSGAKLQKMYIYRPGDPDDLWQQSSQKEFGISVTGSNQQIIDCTLRGLRTAIAVRRQARKTTIYHCDLDKCLGGVLNIEDSFGEDHGLLIEQCSIGSSYSGDSIQFRGDAANKETAADIVGTVGVIIRNCNIHHAAENCIDFKAAGRVLVENNMLYGNIGSDDGPSHGWNHGGHHMISCGKAWRVEHVIIRNNILMDGAGGIEISGDDYYMYHNTFVNNNRDYTGSDADPWSDKPQLTATEQNAKRNGIRFKNNIAAQHNEAEVTFYLSGSDLHIDGNCYHNTGSTVLGEWTSSQDWTGRNFNDWKKRLQKLSNVKLDDANSMAKDPRFSDDGNGKPTGSPADYELWLGAGSPCLEAAVELTRTTSSGNSKQVTVEDAKYFTSGFGVSSHVEEITINGREYTVDSIDYKTKRIIFTESVRHSAGDKLYSKSYQGDAPDIGAYQMKK
jgi:hypothetical protein